ncbi:MAG TPA: hypothetical protein VMI35_07955 [Puia sp.]|nr:hypothetical protein [Puia sp.]
MAIYFMTAAPKKLLSFFKNAIDEELVTDWSYDKDGDFTHTSKQWINKAWLHPEFENECLSLFTVPPKNAAVSREIYAEYHSRFLEAMITHCYALFSQGIATAQPTQKDNLKAIPQNSSLWDAK